MENSAFARNDRENHIWKTLWTTADNHSNYPRFPQKGKNSFSYPQIIQRGLTGVCGKKDLEGAALKHLQTFSKV